MNIFFSPLSLIFSRGKNRFLKKKESYGFFLLLHPLLYLVKKCLFLWFIPSQQSEKKKLKSAFVGKPIYSLLLKLRKTFPNKLKICQIFSRDNYAGKEGERKGKEREEREGRKKEREKDRIEKEGKEQERKK